MSTGTIVVRQSLGRRLKAARVATGKTLPDVAATQICSRAKLARIEAGSQRVGVADVRALGWLYGLPEAEVEQLVEMAMNTSTEAWWEDYSDVLPPNFSTYIELESAAATLLSWDPELVPGLLQIPDYTAAIGTADPRLTPSQVERNVKVRAQRQNGVFQREHPIRLRAVLGAGVLAREVGGVEVMQQQRDALRSASVEGRATVRVLPWRAGAHAAMHGPFAILTFASQEHPDVLYLETRSGGRYITKPDVVADYHQVFVTIEGMSSPIEEYDS